MRHKQQQRHVVLPLPQTQAHPHRSKQEMPLTHTHTHKQLHSGYKKKLAWPKQAHRHEKGSWPLAAYISATVQVCVSPCMCACIAVCYLMYPGFIVLFPCCCRCSCCSRALNVHKPCLFKPVSLVALVLPRATSAAHCVACRLSERRSLPFGLETCKKAHMCLCNLLAQCACVRVCVCVCDPLAAFLQFTAWKRRRLSDIIMLQRRLSPHGRCMHFRPRPFSRTLTTSSSRKKTTAAAAA